MSKLDHYLLYDHSARWHTTLLAVGAGIIVGVTTEIIGASRNLAIVLCCLAVGCVELVRALRHVTGERPAEKE